MTTIPDANIHCINIKGDFDDAQAIVKAAFADKIFREEVHLGAINSINWARVLAQITYYFYSWLRITDKSVEHSPLLYAVPTGNFGDILAGFYAQKMGLPIDKLIICTNENDVLHRFLETGSYKKIPAHLTIAPSMDISISSNFERYLYYLANESGSLLNDWMNTFETTGEVKLDKHLLHRARSEFSSSSSTKHDILQAMKAVYQKDNYLVCPHTATAVVAVSRLDLDPRTTVILATAHPAKFEEAVTLALAGNQIPDRPSQLDVLFDLPTRTISLPNDLTSIEAFVRENIQKKTSHSSNNTNILLTVLSITAILGLGFFVLTRKGN